jgi:hypothetical protein
MERWLPFGLFAKFAMNPMHETGTPMERALAGIPWKDSDDDRFFHRIKAVMFLADGVIIVNWKLSDCVKY